MRRIRFTIGGLLVVVVFLAVAIAALREATDLWDSVVFTATGALLLASVLLAVHRSGRKRAYWLGFALFGWAYLAASLVPAVETRLATTKLLAYVDAKIPGRSVVFTVSFGTSNPNPTWGGSQAIAFSPNGQTLTARTNGTFRVWNAATGALLGGSSGTSEAFLRIGHSLLALASAVAGGYLSRRLFGGAPGGPSRGQDAPADPTPDGRAGTA
jgi:hypothetical protein